MCGDVRISITRKRAAREEEEVNEGRRKRGAWKCLRDGEGGFYL